MKFSFLLLLTVFPFSFSCSLNYLQGQNSEDSIPEFCFTNANYTKYESSRRNVTLKAGQLEQYKSDNAVFAKNASFETFDEDEPAENETIPCSFVFTNPVTLSIVPGTARNYNGQTLEYTADFEESIKSVSKGTLLTCATLKAGAVTEYVRAEVLCVNDKNLLLEIRKSA